MQSPREMARLREKIGRSYHGLTPDQIANLYGHEVRAIAFEAYAAAREAGSSNAGAGLHIAIRRFFEKLFNLLRRVRNYLKGLGFHTADDIFSRAYEGEFTKREPSPAGTPEEFVSERANVLGTERHPKEHLTVNGQPAWAMVVDNTDHAVTHTVRYRQAIDSDWNHNFYLPPHVRNSVSRGEARVVWADARGIHSMEPMPESMRRDLHQYASVPSSQRGPVMANITPPPPPPGGTTTTSPPPGQTPPPSRLRSAIGNLLDSAAGTRAIEGVYDLSHRVKMLRDEVAARMMGVLPDSRDFYTRKRLFPGRVGTSINEFDSKHLDPLVRFLKDNKITLDEASDYLYARHAGERNKAMDEINPDLGGSGSGMTDDEADLILNDAARKNGPAFSELAKRVAEMRNWTLRYMEKSGLEKPETIKSWRDKYTDYVPLRGWEVPPSDFQEPPRGSGIGFNIRGREVQPAFGRRSKADNPLINTIEQAYRTVERGEKNRYLNTLYRALKELGPNNSADIGTLDKGKPKREIDKTTGLVHFVDTTNQFGNPNAVHLKIDGDQHFIVFNDRELAEAVRRLSPDSLGPLQFILKLQNKLKAIWTHYSPDFLAGHFLGRYPIEGTLNSFELKESGKHKINKYVRDGFPFLGNASRAIFLSHKGEVSEDPEIKRLQDEWKQLSKAGGAMVFRNMRDIDLLGEHMRTQLIGLRGKPLETIRAKWRRAIEAMDVVTNALDNALRLAAGSAALRQGKSIDQAALIAREATVDFQLKGKWSNIIGVWFPFANVANQTAARMAKALYRSRIMRRVFIGTMLAGFLTSAFNYLFYGNDKDGVPFFDKIPPWEKRLNFIVLTPANDKEGRPEPFKVPMPYNWAMPLMLGYAFGNAIWGSTGIGKNLSEVIHSLLEGLTPMGNEASIAGLASPELIRPVTHISANKDWTGRPVHTDPLFQHGLSSESPLKGKRAAGTGYQIAARGISKATAGLIDLYPEDIREIFGYMLSTPLKQASEFVTTGKSLAKLEMPDPTQFPVLRRFWGADYDAATQARLGERQHEITHPWESGATIEDITKWQRESFQAIQAERVKVNRDTSLSPEDRRTQLADLAHRRKSVESTAARARAEIKRLHRKENTRTTLEAPPQLTE
jgi:hypothetical protein